MHWSTQETLQTPRPAASNLFAEVFGPPEHVWIFQEKRSLERENLLKSLNQAGYVQDCQDAG